MNLKNTKLYLFALIFFGAAVTVSANDLKINNISLTGQNVSEGYVQIQFDLSWENSWRVTDGSSEWWDAAWIFVKYRIAGDTEWHHAYLHNTGHSAGSGTSALVQTGLIDESIAFDAETNPGMGAFLYRNAMGDGTFSVTGAQLRWNYTENGVDDTDLVDVQVFATEMIYIPEGSFYAGDGQGDGENNRDQFYEGDSPGTPFHVTSEDPLTIGESAGQIYYTQEFNNDNIQKEATLSADFPKGYAAFYIMKYPVTQQQYVDFLNALTPTQADNRFLEAFEKPDDIFQDQFRGRNKLTLTDELYETELPYVPIHRISAREPWAYASWSSMRIMTELEFEKAARGPLTPVEGEYAWGTIQINEDRYVVGDQDLESEFIAENYNTTRGNAIYRDTRFFLDGEQSFSNSGAARVGIFATSSSNRVQAGASYYGVMDMSGNVADFVIAIGNDFERQVTGVHGNGTLDADGNHTFDLDVDVPTPNLIDPVEPWDIVFASARGGGFDANIEFGSIIRMQVSMRILSSLDASKGFDTFSSGNNYGWGFRTARSAPSSPAE